MSEAKNESSANGASLERLVRFLLMIISNNFFGWIFIGFGISSAVGIGVRPSTTESLLWLIIAKLCFVHADMKT